MQIAFVAILIVALLLALISFTIMGLKHLAHMKALARYAHQRGIHFSREDPFDVPIRYGQFAIISCGHSPRAYNVMYGQLGRWAGRAFTFRYEVGHGTRRTTRHYGIVVLEINPSDGSDLPGVLMWNNGDDQQAPLEVRYGEGDVLCWRFVGNADLAEVLAQSAPALGKKGLNMQIRGNLLMLAMPAFGPGQWDYASWIDEALSIPAALEANAEKLTCRASTL